MIDFSKKKVAILGFGIEGQDASDYLVKVGAEVTVFDQKGEADLPDTSPLKKKRVLFSLGPRYLDRGLTGFDYIVRSPAFNRHLPIIKKAERNGSSITSATKIFFDLCLGKIIGVTGTKGKGTTSTLIYETLKEEGKKVFLAGNIGRGLLTLLPKIDEETWVVLELSSFQLQDLDKSPHVAVVLFIAPEHLNYHEDLEEYIRAKRNIILHQTASDIAVLNADNPISSSFATDTKARLFYFSRVKEADAYVKEGKIVVQKELIGEVKKLSLKGEHNWDNVLATSLTCSLVGVRKKTLQKVIFSFSGLPHRLEFIRKINRVSFYNDSFSTIPQTSIAAIRSFNEPLVLILGGSDKGSDYSALGEELAKRKVKTLILIGKMAESIKKKALSAGFKGKIIEPSGSMDEIVNVAYKEALPGGVVLLSPACASFDMFSNYKERGESFRKNVQAL